MGQFYTILTLQNNSYTALTHWSCDIYEVVILKGRLYKKI